MNQLEERVRVLEAQLRAFRIMAGMTMLVLVSCAALSAQEPVESPRVPDKIEAGEFVVVREGSERIRIGFDESNGRWPGVFIRAESGEEQISLSLREQSPDLSFFKPDGTIQLWAHADPGGSVNVSIHDEAAQIGGFSGGGGKARFSAKHAGGWWNSP